MAKSLSDDKPPLIEAQNENPNAMGNMTKITDPKVKKEVEAMFSKDRNKNLLHLKREKFIYGGRKIFEWDQNLEEVTLWIPVPSHIKAKDIICEFSENHLKIVQKGKYKAFCDFDLAYNISKVDSTWYFDDDNIMIVSLTKLKISENWLRIFKKQEPVNPINAEKSKKSMLLERFARENPNFDFSSATFDGHCPDPGKFLDGINPDNFKKDVN